MSNALRIYVTPQYMLQYVTCIVTLYCKIFLN